jgi:4-hydroxyproline epimerase
MAIHYFKCIDGHTCGNPVRLVVEGGPELKGSSIIEKRLHFMEEFDWIRTGLMFEPRGHDMMSGSILYPPNDPKNDVAVLYIETSGCLPMCGHGTIGMVTLAIQEGIIKPKVPGKLRLETPAGLVEVRYEQVGERITSVKLTNIASYLAATELEVDCPELGTLIVDVAYGGNYYAIIDPQKNYKGLEQYTTAQIIPWSRAIRKEMNKRYTFEHPVDPLIGGLSHVMWTGKTLDEKSSARNAVFYGEKAIDRSPCGTGTSARMAQWYAKGLLKQGEDFIHESIIGSTFTGRIEALAKVGTFDAIIPSIEGWAICTGYNTILIDDADPFKNGFSVI